MREGSQSRGQGGSGETRFVTVHTPKAHEGVGMALRHVYSAERNSLPSDMTELLDQLDGV